MPKENQGLLIVLGVLVVALLIGPVLMGGMMGPGFMGPGMMGWGYSGGALGTTSGWVWGLGIALGGLIMLAFWGAVIVGIVLLVRSLTGGLGGHAGSTRSEDPLAILRGRYAAGEIDQATFERMRSELGDPQQPTPTNGHAQALR